MTKTTDLSFVQHLALGMGIFYLVWFCEGFFHCLVGWLLGLFNLFIVKFFVCLRGKKGMKTQ